MHVVRATFCEVWWMCAFDVRCGAHRHDVARWVASIAERRCDERRRAVDLALRDAPPADQAAFWTGLLADHDMSTQFQLATMLDGHDAIDPSPGPAAPGRAGQYLDVIAKRPDYVGRDVLDRVVWDGVEPPLSASPVVSAADSDGSWCLAVEAVDPGCRAEVPGSNCARTPPCGYDDDSLSGSSGFCVGVFGRLNM
jgi:hypothetical protein